MRLVKFHIYTILFQDSSRSKTQKSRTAAMVAALMPIPMAATVSPTVISTENPKKMNKSRITHIMQIAAYKVEKKPVPAATTSTAPLCARQSRVSHGSLSTHQIHQLTDVSNMPSGKIRNFQRRTFFVTSNSEEALKTCSHVSGHFHNFYIFLTGCKATITGEVKCGICTLCCTQTCACSCTRSSRTYIGDHGIHLYCY